MPLPYRKDEAMVGALVLAAGALLFVGLLWVGAFPKYGETVTAVTSLRTLGGLPFPSPVKYAGHDIGEVTAVDYIAGNMLDGGFADTAFLKVTMALRADIPLPKYARAMVSSGSMLGDPYLDIKRYTDEEIALASADGTLGSMEIRNVDGVYVLPAENPTSIGEILSEGRQILSDVRRFTARLGAIGDTVEHVVEGARRIVADDGFREDIHGTVASARSGADRFDAAMARLPGAIDEFHGLASDGRGVARRADTLVGRVDDIVARRGDTIAANFQTFSERIANNPSSLVWGGTRPGRGAGTSSPTAYR